MVVLLIVILHRNVRREGRNQKLTQTLLTKLYHSSPKIVHSLALYEICCSYWSFVCFWRYDLVYPSFFWQVPKNTFKVHIFWEGHKILRNLHCRFDRYYIHRTNLRWWFCRFLVSFSQNLNFILYADYSYKIQNSGSMSKISEIFLPKQHFNLSRHDSVLGEKYLLPYDDATLCISRHQGQSYICTYSNKENKTEISTYVINIRKIVTYL